MLVTIAEGVQGRPFSDRTREEWIMRVGLDADRLAVRLTVMFNDLKSLVTSLFS